METTKNRHRQRTTQFEGGEETYKVERQAAKTQNEADTSEGAENASDKETKQNREREPSQQEQKAPQGTKNADMSEIDEGEDEGEASAGKSDEIAEAKEETSHKGREMMHMRPDLCDLLKKSLM